MATKDEGRALKGYQKHSFKKNHCFILKPNTKGPYANAFFILATMERIKNKISRDKKES